MPARALSGAFLVESAAAAYDPNSYVPEWRPPPPRVIYPPQPEPESVVAHDWGHLGRQVIGGWLGREEEGYPEGYRGLVGGGAGANGMPENGAREAAAVTGGLGPESCEGMVWSGGVPPKGFKVVNWCGKGVLRKVRRRRRRRILTASDKADISYIVSTTGKGQLAASLIHKSTH